MAEKPCRFCKTKFEPKKDFYFICPECIKKCAKCKTCGKIVKENSNGYFTCCGRIEIKEHSPVTRSRVVRSVEKVEDIFDPVAVHWNEDNEEFNDYEGIPNT